MMKAKQGRFSFSAGRYTRNDGKAANSKRRLVLVYWAVVVASFVASLVLLVRTDLRLPSVYKTDNYNYNGADDNHNNNAMHMHIVLPASNNSNSNSYDDGDNSMDAAEEEEKTTKEEETETEEEADVPVDGNSTSEQKQKQQQQQQPVLPAPTAKIVTVSLKVSNHNWDRIRYVCGKAIRPNGIVVVNATVDLQATDVNADPSSLSTTTTTAASASDFYNNHNHNCVASLDESTGTFGVFSSTRVFPYDPPLRKTKKKSENHHNNNHNNYTQPGVIFRYNRKVDVPVSLDSYEAVRGCDIPCVRCGDFSSSSSSSGTTGGSGGVIGGWVTVEDTPFVIRAMSMEGPGYYPSLIVDHRAHWKHQYYATTALQESDVPIAYYNVGRNDNDDLRSTPPVDFDDGIRGASFLARNCRSLNHREDLVRDLIRDAATISSNNQTQSPPFLFRIDSLSSCVHYAPHGFPNGTSQASSKRDILKRYLFHLAFENHNADDYVTEKLWSTLESGTIPVYFGAPNIIRGNDSNGNNGNGNNNQLLPHPHRSIIDVSDFVVDASKEDGKERRHHGINTTALVEYIWTVATNRTLYYSYHAWRTKWWENNRNNNNNNNNSNSNSNSNSNDDTNTTIEEYYRRFLDTWEFTRTGLNCRICRFFYALRYGWGWDHRRQELRELHPLPADDDDDDEFGDFVRREIQPTGYNRTTCFLEHNGRMVFPMQEFWATDDGDYNADGHNNEVRREIRCTSSGGGDGDGSQKWHRRMVTAKGGGDDEFLRTIRDHDGVTDMVLVRQQTTKHRSTAGAAGAGATSSEEEEAEAPTTSSFRLVTPFGKKKNSTCNLIAVKRHVSYRVLSAWREESFRREASRPDRKSRKRVRPHEYKEDPFWETRGTLVWIQDDKSRIVLMVDSPRAIIVPGYSSSHLEQAGNNVAAMDEHGALSGRSRPFYEKLPWVPGTIEIGLPKGIQTLRLRWLVEDVDTFAYHSDAVVPTDDDDHAIDGEDEFLKFGKETYFSSLMVDEFFHPLNVEVVP